MYEAEHGAEGPGAGLRDLYSGSFGSRTHLLAKMMAVNNSVIKNNPEAFVPDSARQTDLARVMAVEDARLRLEIANDNITHPGEVPPGQSDSNAWAEWLKLSSESPDKANDFKEAILGIAVGQ